jgi:hypothetical protein
MIQKISGRYEQFEVIGKKRQSEVLQYAASDLTHMQMERCGSLLKCEVLIDMAQVRTILTISLTWKWNMLPGDAS